MRCWSVLGGLCVFSVLVGAGCALSQQPAVAELPAAWTQVKLNRPMGLSYDAHDRLIVADSGNNRILIFDPNRPEVRSVFGQGVAELLNPQDAAVDSAGRIIVADTGHNRIVVFDSDGTFVKAFGSKGTADGQFNHPTNITIDDHDNIIVTDRFNHRLQVFDRQGRHLFTLANRTGTKSPQRIELERQWQIQDDEYKHARNPHHRIRKPEQIKINPQWQRTDVGQLNEPGGTYYDPKLKRLYVANGWNCRTEVFDYDSSTGRISRRGPFKGIVWGPWITRGCAGTPDGKHLVLQTAFGSVLVYNDRADMDSHTPVSSNVGGGTYGSLRELMDIAVNSAGEIALCNTSNNRIVIMSSDFSMPPAPRVVKVSDTSATIVWTDPTIRSTVVRYRQGDYPARTPGHEDDWKDVQLKQVQTTRPLGPGGEHRITLLGLQPGKRIYYRIKSPAFRCIPDSGWSREYAIATEAGPGRKTVIRATVKILLAPNVINLSSLKDGATRPEPMSEQDIKRYYLDQFAQTRLFYWHNSRMRFWIDYDVYVDRTMYKKGQLPQGVQVDEWFTKLPRLNADASLQRLIKQAGREKKVYYGQVVCEAERRWDPNRKLWYYQGSGGGTYGVEWPAPGRTHFLGGSDIAWLFCHEYKHQVESQYANSGLNSEDDRLWFCHFSPKYDDPNTPNVEWKWDTAADHGEHWDGIAWQLRHFTDVQYLRNIYGFVEVVADSDNDGIPDDDPRLPSDEKRLGSDPYSADSDGDGLADMDEVLASTWVKCMLAAVRKKVPGEFFRPDLRNPDSDGDGIRDGQDPYPIYPFEPVIRRGTVTVDADLRDMGKPQCWLRHKAEGVDVELFSRYDENWLYYGLKINGKTDGLILVTDNDADGFYYGNDNCYIEIGPDGTLRNVRMHMASMNRWPFFDNEHKFLKPEQLKYARSVAKDGTVFVELAIPRDPKLGLDCRKGEQVGLMLYVGLPGKGQISMCEPYHIFDSKLQ